MKAKTRKYTFPSMKRPDGEEFALSATFHELEEPHDYWLVSYQAAHKDWNYMPFTLTIPKAIAKTADLAEAIINGAGLRQVESLLMHATKRGRPLGAVFSVDGWVLI
ncbi:hypothetical protein [Burkholderia vietnamiensis]|uniref:hypothetical protein n=1 Tax=Burkholderia vietnamiensis TaxID=60552 RepID=UPI000A7DDBF5|nr:hypothetical protein [Burkholderia vietnamiensis]MCA8291833.1 hypothetical protein [Burkholderia vietnamiensis]